MTDDRVVTAVQHFDLATILLTVYDTRIPRLGPAQRTALKRIEVSSNYTRGPFELVIDDTRKRSVS